MAPPPHVSPHPLHGNASRAASTTWQAMRRAAASLCGHSSASPSPEYLKLAASSSSLPPWCRASLLVNAAFDSLTRRNFSSSGFVRILLRMESSVLSPVRTHAQSGASPPTKRCTALPTRSFSCCISCGSSAPSAVPPVSAFP
eukprot:CAMPEP_0181303948 /NCGR_PEP_ID=MMETSP1101-20121128/8858_1 /TAXON_ID=46948 /ORGANISM="Rhodomonas abbreviata, Strain Caron Lab Isolate" /LENGTH=142 /DNA_ID=CAMNT_0023409611 /DNA_START=721 /DNA_END=1146 /DNA_ORIENTATION=-